MTRRRTRRSYLSDAVDAALTFDGKLAVVCYPIDHEGDLLTSVVVRYLGERSLASVAPGNASWSPMMQRRRTILWIESHSAIAQTIKSTLAPGHDLICTRSWQEAISLIRRGIELDVIFCELVGARIDGLKLYSFLQRLSPAMADRIVFIVDRPLDLMQQAFLGAVENLRIDNSNKLGKLRDVLQFGQR